MDQPVLRERLPECAQTGGPSDGEDAAVPVSSHRQVWVHGFDVLPSLRKVAAMTRWVGDGFDRIAHAMQLAAEAGEPMGLDTEFYNVDLSHDSCVARSKVHIWSIALHRHPLIRTSRGYYPSEAVVLPVAALDNVRIRHLLEHPDFIKAIHNQPVDDHSLSNHGIHIRGAVNTLDMARWVYPERVPSGGGRGFDLDSLGEDKMGIGKAEGFTDIFTEEYDDPWYTTRQETRCECGAVPCRRRGLGHTRHKEEVVTRHERVSSRPIPLESVVPGHPLFARMVEYAGRDAVIALGLYDIMTAVQARRPSPW
jgi:hypothetical protein